MTAADGAAIANLWIIALLLSRPPMEGVKHANINSTALFDPKLTGLFRLVSSHPTGSACWLPLRGSEFGVPIASGRPPLDPVEEHTRRETHICFMGSGRHQSDTPTSQDSTYADAVSRIHVLRTY